MTFDDVIEIKIGPIGWWQFRMGILIVTSLGDSMQLIPQLANLRPPFVCSGSWFKGWTYHDVVNISSQIADLQQQRFDSKNKTSTPDLKCRRYDLSNIDIVTNNQSKKIEEKMADILTFANDSRLSYEKCRGPWLYDSASARYHYSLIQGFDMVCHRRYLIPYSAIIYTIGSGIGVSVAGQLADRYGRRFIFCIAYPLIGLFGSLVIFPSNVIVFLLLRLCIGFFSMMFYASSYVYMLEHTNHKHRNSFSLIEGLFEIGFVRNLGVIINYLIQDYRYVHLTCGIMILCVSVILILFLDESPRWLVARGRHAEALVILKKAVLRNGGSQEDAKALTEEDICLTQIEITASKDNKGTLQHLRFVLRDWIDFFSHPQSIKRWVPLMVMWISIACVYYGVNYYGVRLKNINPYLTAFIMSIFAFPARLLQWVLFDKFDRKKPVIGMFFAALIFCVIGLIAKITKAPNEIIVVSATLIISLATCLFASLYLVTTELFPTTLRAKSVGFLSAVCRFGVMAGMFIELLEGFLPLLCFSFILACGFLATLFLPRGDYKTMLEKFENEQNDKIKA